MALVNTWDETIIYFIGKKEEGKGARKAFLGYFFHGNEKLSKTLDTALSPVIPTCPLVVVSLGIYNYIISPHS